MILSFEELRSVIESGGRFKVRRVYGKPYLYLVYPDGSERCAGRLDEYPEDVRAWIESVRRARAGNGATRYKKLHYKNVTIRRELWEELRRSADEEGFTIPDFIEKMYKVYIARRGSRAIPVYKTITSRGEVAYAITVDGETVTLTYRELRALCRSGLVAITLCAKTILA